MEEILNIFSKETEDSFINRRFYGNIKRIRESDRMAGYYFFHIGDLQPVINKYDGNIKNILKLV